MPSAEAGGRGSDGPPPAAAASPATSPAAGFRRVGERTVFRGHVFSVVQAAFEAPDGAPFERDIVRHPGAVAVVPVTDRGTVVLLRQYRPAIERWILEIPAGTCDVDGEAAEATAARELAEEAGYRADRLAPLAEILNSPGFCDESTWIYLATGLHAVPHGREGVEERHLLVEEVGLDAVDGLVEDGSVLDAQTLIGVLLARRRLVGRA